MTKKACETCADYDVSPNTYPCSQCDDYRHWRAVGSPAVVDTLEQKLATALHRRFCRSDHMEQCSWEWENTRVPRGQQNWSGDAHREWLHKACDLIPALERLGFKKGGEQDGKTE